MPNENRTFSDRFRSLLDSYRSAKRDARRDAIRADDIGDRGNYELDGGSPSADAEASSSREHRTAMALADAALARADGDRTSRTSRDRTSTPGGRPSPHNPSPT
jgi:hypothetical protein